MKARGVALVSVLLIVAVAVALAYEVAERHSLNLARSSLALDGSQAREYALAGEQLARQVLHLDWQEPQTRALDTLLEAWSQPLTVPIDSEFGTVQAHVQDLGGRFNLNAVLGRDGEKNMMRLKRLLTHLEIDPNVGDQWLDWVDGDGDVHGFGAEDAERLGDEPPRRTANQAAVHASEFFVATETTREEYDRLRPHVAALPFLELAINVNTASPMVLGILTDDSSPAEAVRIADFPREYAEVQQFISAHPMFGEAQDALRVGSEFFRVQVRAEAGGARTELTSLLHRDPQEGSLGLLRRSFGERFDVSPSEEDEDRSRARDRRQATRLGRALTGGTLRVRLSAVQATLVLVSSACPRHA